MLYTCPQARRSVNRLKLDIKNASDVHIENILDESLIAGVKIQIGDTVIDLNVKNKLQQLKQKLVA